MARDIVDNVTKFSMSFNMRKTEEKKIHIHKRGEQAKREEQEGTREKKIR